MSKPYKIEVGDTVKHTPKSRGFGRVVKVHPAMQTFDVQWQDGTITRADLRPSDELVRVPTDTQEYEEEVEDRQDDPVTLIHNLRALVKEWKNYPNDPCLDASRDARNRITERCSTKEDCADQLEYLLKRAGVEV